MKPAAKFVSIATNLVVLAVFAPSQLWAAPILLTYTGQTYDSVHNDPLMDGEYNLSMRVTGWIELADPLDPNCLCSFSLGSGLTDFSFSDGVLLHSRDEGAEFATVRFATDASAHIVDWLVYINDTLGPDAPLGGSDVDFYISSGPSALWPVPVTGDHSSSTCDNCDEPRVVWHGFDSSGQGQWREVPEPGSSTLLLLGLAGLGAVLSTLGRRTTRPGTIMRP